MLDASQSVNLVFYYYHTRAVMIFFVGQSETMHHVYISRAMTLVGLSLTPFTGKLKVRRYPLQVVTVSCVKVKLNYVKEDSLCISKRRTIKLLLFCSFMQELAKSDAADFNPHTEMSTNRERLSLVSHKPHSDKPDNWYDDFQ
jgi:hypothetical protein